MVVRTRVKGQTINDLPIKTVLKTRDRATRTPRKTEVKPRAPEEKAVRATNGSHRETRYKL